MEQFDRKALKDKFKKGKMPSEQDFSGLIDSMINILEEGINKTEDDGLKLAQLGSGRLMSFYENIAVETPLWCLSLGRGGDNKLHLGTQKSPHVLTLRSHEEEQNGQLHTQVAVGINKEMPQVALDVNGTLAASGRRGQFGDMPVLADGSWQGITPVLTGCEAFEVVAGIGGKDSEGQYALLHAIALNTFGKGSIEQQHSFFGNKCNRIELRWEKIPEQGTFHYQLQMRVQCTYFDKDDKNKIWVKYHISRLWFDTWMLESNKE